MSKRLSLGLPPAGSSSSTPASPTPPPVPPPGPTPNPGNGSGSNGPQGIPPWMIAAAFVFMLVMMTLFAALFIPAIAIPVLAVGLVVTILGGTVVFGALLASKGEAGKSASAGTGKSATKAPFPTDMGYSVPEVQGMTVPMGADSILLLRNRIVGGRIPADIQGDLDDDALKGWYIEGDSSAGTFLRSGGRKPAPLRFGANTAFTIPVALEPYAVLDVSDPQPFEISGAFNLPLEDVTLTVQVRPRFDTTVEGMLRAISQPEKATFKQLLTDDLERSLKVAIEELLTENSADPNSLAAILADTTLPDAEKRLKVVTWFRKNKREVARKAMEGNGTFTGFKEAAYRRGFSKGDNGTLSTEFDILLLSDDSLTLAIEEAEKDRRKGEAKLAPYIQALKDNPELMQAVQDAAKSDGGGLLMGALLARTFGFGGGGTGGSGGGSGSSGSGSSGGSSSGTGTSGGSGTSGT